MCPKKPCSDLDFQKGIQSKQGSRKVAAAQIVDLASTGLEGSIVFLRVPGVQASSSKRDCPN